MVKLTDDGVETDLINGSQFLDEFYAEWLSAARSGATPDQLYNWFDCMGEIYLKLCGRLAESVTLTPEGHLLSAGIGGFLVEESIQ